VNKHDTFFEYKNFLFSIAYNMLGTVEDAEDLVQETYLKWLELDTDKIQYPKAFLVKIITNLSINELKSARKKREDYIGIWLPEPLMKETISGSIETIDLYHSLSIGMMVLLEKLTPPERAVFLLKEVFSYDFTEIAEIIEKSQVNCRQIYKRAKDHLGGSEKRFKVDVRVHEKILNRFLGAVNDGSIDELIALLREDIVLIADGGGKSLRFGGKKFAAALRPINGKKNVSKFVIHVGEKIEKFVPGVLSKVIHINGLPSVITYSYSTPICVLSLEITGDKIHGIYLNANPDKLRKL
jgi:RNA polymerase sigma-70 factor (ECF subfamily)